jgi:TolB-like protein/Tfp pilus assembly protein PilF
MQNFPNRLSLFWNELKRRKVIPVLVGYVAACIAIISFFLDSSEIFSVPEATIRLLYLLSAVGIPLVVFLPWYINRKREKELAEGSTGSETDTRSDIPFIQDNSIIVLPFENISNDPEQEYFSDGLTEEIITDLSYIDDLLVISRSSAMTFKGTKKTIKEITKAVQVRYALEGSVRKAGNKVRVVAQLIDGTSDSHIWADKYNGTLEDIFNIQEVVSRSIASALKIKLSSWEKEKIDKRPIDNAFAYDCYKRANPEINSMIKDRIDYGLSLLNKGLEVAGENAVIYAGIGAGYMQYVNNGFDAEENIIKAEEFLEKALNLDPELPEAHFTLGMIVTFKEGDAHSAIDHIKRAHTSKPEDPDIMFWLALLYALAGQNEAALMLVDTIARIDPFNQYCDAVRGWVLFFSGSYETAQVSLFAAYKLAPESPMHRFWKALILFYHNRADEAFDFMEEVVDDSDTNIWTSMTLALKHTIKRDRNKMSSLLSPELVAQAQRDLQFSFHLATFYSYLEEKAESLKWLENAVNRGFTNYPLISEQDILLENLREEPGFKSLMKKVKKEWDHFEI